MKLHSKPKREKNERKKSKTDHVVKQLYLKFLAEQGIGKKEKKEPA